MQLMAYYDLLCPMQKKNLSIMLIIKPYKNILRKKETLFMSPYESI